jgi:pyruvyl transferase EpsO
MSYERDGFAGPFVALEPNEMHALRDRLDQVIAARRVQAEIASAVHPEGNDEPVCSVAAVWNAHLDDRTVFELATHPAVLTEVARVAGPDLLLWRTTFWVKDPRASRIEWHQDTYKREGLGARGIVTAWMAIDEVLTENAVQLVAGSHKRVLPESAFQQPEYLAALRESPALPPPPVGDELPAVMAMAPGSFFVFDQLILHGSPPNPPERRRIGLAVRFLTADADPSGISDVCIPVAGRVRNRNIRHRGFRVASPPPRSLRGALSSRRRLARDGGSGSWSSALVDDGAVFHRHALVLFEALRERLQQGDRVVLCGFEEHDNVGDSAVYLATLVLLKSLGVAIDASVTWRQGSRMLPSLLHRQTRVVFVGGGHFGDLYPALHNCRLDAVTAAAGHLVIQLPVSAWFRDSSTADQTADVISTHGDVVLFARDRQSVDRMAEAELSPVLVPDSIVMLTAGPAAPDQQSAPILWLARTDTESVGIPTRGEPRVEICDWVPATEAQAAVARRFPARLPDAALRRLGIDSHRAMRLRGHHARGAHHSFSRLRSESALDQIARHRIVITDRLHAHLIACLARRPNVILDNLDGKVGAYFETWSKELGLTRTASGPPEAIDLALALLDRA